jgi:hypothetical protein
MPPSSENNASHDDEILLDVSSEDYSNDATSEPTKSIKVKPELITPPLADLNPHSKGNLDVKAIFDDDDDDYGGALDTELLETEAKVMYCSNILPN